MSVGTANGTCHGTAAGHRTARQDLAVACLRHQRHQQHPRNAAAIVIARRAVPLTFPRSLTCAATWPIVPGCPVISSSCCSMMPEPGVISRVPRGLHPPVPAHHRQRHRHRLAEHHQVPAADLLPPPPPSAPSGPSFPPAIPQPGPQVRRPDRDHPARHLSPSATHPPRPLDWQATAPQDTKTRGTPGSEGVSTSSPTRSPTRTRNHGKTLPRVALANPSPIPSSSHTVTSKPNPRPPPKPLIYMALRRQPPLRAHPFSVPTETRP